MKQFCKVFFSLFFLFSLSAFTSWEKDYLNAIKKLEKRDYIEAIKLLNKAISEMGTSCDKCIREGMFFYDYYPHFYLAKAYLALNDLENLSHSIEFLKNEGKIEKNPKLNKEFQILAQSVKKEEKIAEKPPEKPPEEKKEAEKLPEKEIKPAEKPKEEVKKEKLPEIPPKAPEKKEEKPKEPQKPLPLPNIFNEIKNLEDIADNMGTEEFPRLNEKKREHSGEFILLKKNWQESKSERDRQVILERASKLKEKFENLIEIIKFANKIKILKDRIEERVSFFEKNKNKLSKENLKKFENIKLKIKQFKREDLNLKEVEPILTELNEITIEEKKEEKKLDYKNLKSAFISYFQGNFIKAEENLKTAMAYEKDNPYYDFLITLINLTKYYMDENKDNKLLEEAKLSFKRAKEKGLKFENIKNFPLSPKILNQLKSL